MLQMSWNLMDVCTKYCSYKSAFITLIHGYRLIPNSTALFSADSSTFILFVAKFRANKLDYLNVCYLRSFNDF